MENYDEFDTQEDEEESLLSGDEALKVLHDSMDGLRVLLVEDNELNTYLTRILLEKGGCTVTSVSNGEDALNEFRESALFFYDVILMDVRMPVMDGLEATRRIRRLERCDALSVPIVAMTADDFDADRTRTFEAGMNYHLSKPFSTKKLCDVLHRCAVRGNGKKKNGEEKGEKEI